MIPSVLGLFLTMAFVVLLLVSVGVGSALRWQLKASLVAASAAVMIASYLSLVGLLGWPTPFHPGETEMVLLHASVEEPGKSRAGGGSGSIYLWVRSEEAGSAPRALRFPYARDLHQSVVAALEKRDSGTRQGVRIAAEARRGGRAEAFSIFDMRRPRLTGKHQNN